MTPVFIELSSGPDKIFVNANEITSIEPDSRGEGIKSRVYTNDANAYFLAQTPEEIIALVEKKSRAVMNSLAREFSWSSGLKDLLDHIHRKA